MVKKQIAIMIAIILISISIFGCSKGSQTEILTELIGASTANLAEVSSFDFIENKANEGYFLVSQFTLDKEIMRSWLAEAYKAQDCEVFELLADKNFIDEEQSKLSKTARCYRNALIIQSDLAKYNEISLAVKGEQVLLYAAGTAMLTEK